MKIGTQNREDLAKEVSLEYVFKDAELAKFFLNIKGRDYWVDIEDILLISEWDTVSDRDLDSHIQKVSAYLMTIASSEAELDELSENLKLEFDIWLAKKTEQIRYKHPDYSEKKLLNEVMIDSEIGPQYETMKKQMNSVKKLIKKTLKFYEILKQRAELLRTLARSRRELKGGRGYESGI
jgi:hypothetical protein